MLKILKRQISETDDEFEARVNDLVESFMPCRDLHLACTPVVIGDDIAFALTIQKVDDWHQYGKGTSLMHDATRAEVAKELATGPRKVAAATGPRPSILRPQGG